MSKKIPTQWEVVDKDGQTHGPFHNFIEAAKYANEHWPDQAQDEDRMGAGWDIQAAGLRD